LNQNDLKDFPSRISSMTEKNYKLANKLVEYSRRSKILEKKEEFYLITKWRDEKDQKALQKILNAYLRLSVSYAKKYINYGIPLDDLIHEGVIGIMHALEKFDISKDFRLSTYASWWIRASIQDYILKNWSVVRTGSSASQKQLFFNLKKIKKKILDVSRDFMGQDEINSVSKMLNVKSLDIQNMESRLSRGDVYLNQRIGDEDGNELMSLLPDNSKNPEELAEMYFDNKSKTDWLMKAIEQLSEREKIIIQSRKLVENAMTLGQLGKKLNISKERVRQIETKALNKIKKTIIEISCQNKEFFV
jgi:RNA polymerase sigma-32 factor